MKYKSSEELDKYIKNEKDYKYTLFLHGSKEEREHILSKYGIRYGGEYCGRYDIISREVIIESKKNPFTGETLTASLERCNRAVRNGENIIVKLDARRGIECGAEDIFICYYVKSEDKAKGDFPIFKKSQIEKERNKEEHMEEKRPQIKDILMTFTKKDLEELAWIKDLKVNGMRKELAASVIAKHFTNAERFENFFCCVDEMLFDYMEYMCKEPEAVPDDVLIAEPLLDAGYAFLKEDGLIVVPQEIYHMFNELDYDKLMEKRHEYRRILKCIDFSSAFYGAAPVEIVLRIINSLEGKRITDEELNDFIDNIPEELNDYIIEDGYLYHIDYYDDEDELFDAQGDIDYYIPAPEEVEEFDRCGALMNNEAFEKFKEYIQTLFDLDTAEAIYAVCLAQVIARAGAPLEGLAEIFENLELDPDEEQCEKFMDAFIEFAENTRSLVFRGHTGAEIFEEEDNVIDFAEAKAKREKK